MLSKIREILLTEYIGAILVALLASQAIIALLNLLVSQIYWHAYLSRRYPGFPRESPGHSILTTLVEMALYLISAYLIARWLYGAKPSTIRDSKRTKREEV